MGFLFISYEWAICLQKEISWPPVFYIFSYMRKACMLMLGEKWTAAFMWKNKLWYNICPTTLASKNLDRQFSFNLAYKRKYINLQLRFNKNPNMVLFLMISHFDNSFAPLFLQRIIQLSTHFVQFFISDGC